MPLTPGSRLGIHELVGPLGAGGMGEVYRARDTRPGREVYEHDPYVSQLRGEPRFEALLAKAKAEAGRW